MLEDGPGRLGGLRAQRSWDTHSDLHSHCLVFELCHLVKKSAAMASRWLLTEELICQRACGVKGHRGLWIQAFPTVPSSVAHDCAGATAHPNRPSPTTTTTASLRAQFKGGEPWLVRGKAAPHPHNILPAHPAFPTTS